MEGDVPRSNATRRPDALADLARWFLDHQQTRRGGRRRPHLNIVIDWDNLLANAAATSETLGGTVFDAATTGRLLCDATLMWAALGIRDRHCRFKGCDRPAAWCQGHYRQPWELGAPTNLQNLVMLCTRHLASVSPVGG